MISREDLYELVEQLNTTIGMLENEYDTDLGACVLISAIVAEQLEKRRINYSVVLYVDNVAKTNDVEEIMKNEELWHMCISVSKMEIDGNQEISPEVLKEYVRKFKTKMNSSELYGLYDKYDFNQTYDRKNDEIVKKEIVDCFEHVL